MMIAVPGFSFDKILAADAGVLSATPAMLDNGAPVVDATFEKLLSGLAVSPVPAASTEALPMTEEAEPVIASKTPEDEEAPDASDEIVLALPEFALARIVPPLGATPGKSSTAIEAPVADPSIPGAQVHPSSNPDAPIAQLGATVLPAAALPADGAPAMPEPQLADDMLAPASREPVVDKAMIREILNLKPEVPGKTEISAEFPKSAPATILSVKPLPDAIAATQNAGESVAKRTKGEPLSLAVAAPSSASVYFDATVPSQAPVTPAPATVESLRPTDPASVDLGGRLGDQAIQTRLDIANESEWMDRVARDIAQFAGKDGSLKFQLNPENLGSLHVEISHAADGVSLRFGTETEGARNVLADAQQRLANEARAQGVRIAETHIDFGNHNNGSGQKTPQTQPQIITQGQAQGAEPVEKPRSKPLERFA